jgi:hypothetical protein
MSYEPTLIIKYCDLKKIESELEEEQYSKNIVVSKIAKFLLEELWDEKIDFEDKRIIISKPEFTSFNALVRERLDEGSVYYKTTI